MMMNKYGLLPFSLVVNMFPKLDTMFMVYMMHERKYILDRQMDYVLKCKIHVDYLLIGIKCRKWFMYICTSKLQRFVVCGT